MPDNGNHSFNFRVWADQSTLKRCRATRPCGRSALIRAINFAYV